MKKAKNILVPVWVALVLTVILLGWWMSAPIEQKKDAARALSNPVRGNSPSSIVSAPDSSPPGPPPTIEEGRTATEKVDKMVTSYHTRMGQNPVGTNAEIMHCLLGGNPLHATFSPEAVKLNAKGELIDPWGTPYFFHQISGDHMEIWSAGPDKIMGTADDIIEN